MSPYLAFVNPWPASVGLGTAAAELADVDHAALVGADADRAVALGDLDVEAQLAVVDDLAKGRADGARAPSRAAATCLTQTSKPTVALPSGRFSKESIDEQRSIIAIIPGVESTRMPIVPPTSVTSRSSTVNSSTARSPARAPSPDHPQAAGDAERLAGDVGRVVGGEEGDRRGDLLGLAEPAQLRRRPSSSRRSSRRSRRTRAPPSAAASRSGPGRSSWR